MNTLQPLVEFYKTHKWGQGSHGLGYAYCLVEARIELRYHPEIESGATGILGAIGNELRKRCHGNVVGFNDATGRKFSEVLEMLEQDDTS